MKWGDKMENGYELLMELLNLYCKDKISLSEFYKLQRLLNKILEELEAENIKK